MANYKKYKNKDAIFYSYNNITKDTVSYYKIHYGDLVTLGNASFINDYIINFYLRMIKDYSKERNFFLFENYYYNSIYENPEDSYQNYRPKFESDILDKIFNNNIIVFPICDKNHWSLIILKDLNLINNIIFRNGSSEFPTLFYLDSYLQLNFSDERIQKILNYFILLYLEKNYKLCLYDDLYHEKITNIVNAIKNKIKVNICNVPQQNNCYDCGLYLMTYYELFLLDPLYFLENFSNLDNWFDNSIIVNKRDKIKNLISLLKKTGNFIKEKEIVILNYLNERNLDCKSTQKIKTEKIKEDEKSTDDEEKQGDLYIEIETC